MARQTKKATNNIVKPETKAAAAKTTVEVKAADTAVKAEAVKEVPEVKAAEPEVKAVEKKEPAKKAAVKKTTVKAELKVETVLQFAGKEVTEQDVLKKVKEVWTKELKKKVGDMKSVNIYLKPEDFAAYYVVNNGEAEGKIEL